MTDLLIQIGRLADREAFDELYGLYGHRIKSFMIRRGADAALAEELTQEAFLAVWRKARLFDPTRGDEAGWIFTIARNLFIDRVRRQKAFHEMVAAIEPPAATTDKDDVFDRVAADQAAARVKRAIAELTKDQADVIQLAFVEGLAHPEIAARLNVPLGTVKSRMRLAYAKLRTSLEDLA